jgi:hypothetical protein
MLLSLEGTRGLISTLRRMKNLRCLLLVTKENVYIAIFLFKATYWSLYLLVAFISNYADLKHVKDK